MGRGWIKRVATALAMLGAAAAFAQGGAAASSPSSGEPGGGMAPWLRDLPSMQPEPVVPEPTMAVARKAVYGGATWRDVRAEPFFNRDTILRVYEVFRVRYREQERDKLMLVYQLTPGPREQFACHACLPVLGAAVMAQAPASEGGAWRVQARGLVLMAGAPFSGAEDLQMLPLSPGRWALRSRQHDVVQGYETRRERLVIQQGERLLLALDEGFVEKPGPGLCGTGAAVQGTVLQQLSGSDEVPRVELTLRYNEGACPAPSARVERRRFALREGRFQPE